MYINTLLKRYSRTPFDPHRAIAEKLLRDVWGFSATQRVPEVKAASCFYHYEALLEDRRLLDDHNTVLRDSQHQSTDVAALISVLKAQRQSSVLDIHAHLKQNTPHWVIDHTNPQTLDNILQFAVRLWLFTKPDLTNKTLTLQDAIQGPLLKIRSPANSWLWLDFSAETLKKRAGFHIDYTSDLSQHLTFASRSVIRVFSHACVLERYHNASNGGIESTIYPQGFLDEVLKTLNLLWPVEDPTTFKHVTRLEAKKFVDVEANMGHEDKHDLTTYEYFGGRLAKIQERLEIEEQRRGTSTGFKIAIWGIVLTAIFGLVSVIVGVVQMWAGLRQIQVV